MYKFLYLGCSAGPRESTKPPWATHHEMKIGTSDYRRKMIPKAYIDVHIKYAWATSYATLACSYGLPVGYIAILIRNHFKDV